MYNEEEYKCVLLDKITGEICEGATAAVYAEAMRRYKEDYTKANLTYVKDTNTYIITGNVCLI